MDEPKIGKEYADKLVKKLSIGEARLYNKYDKLSSRYFKLMLAGILATAMTIGIAEKERYITEKYRPIGVHMYEESQHKLEKAREAYNLEVELQTPKSLDQSWKESELEKIATIESETATLYNSEVNQEYKTELRNTTKTEFYGAAIGIFVAGIFAGIKNYYDGKKQKILRKRMNHLKVVK